MRRIMLVLTLAAVTATATAGAAAADWGQFGGPQRDFSLDKPPRIADWGEEGPRQIWSRELGPGYSALVSSPDGRRLFTQSRDGDEERVLALDADTGKTLWEFRYPAPLGELKWVDMSYGNAPQATPLLIGGRLIGLGFTGVLWAVDADDGNPIWSKHLGKEMKASIPYFGHAASPLWVPSATTGGPDGVVVVLAGGALAFDPGTGEVQWQNRDFDASYASPILADTAFGRQIIAAGAGDIVGLDPEDGSTLWSHEYRNPQKTILGTPLLIEDDLLFVSAYFLGSRGLRLVAKDKVEQVWEQPDFQVSHFNAVRDGSTIYTTFRKNLLALDGKSGEILWRERRFGAANMLRAGAQSLIFGEHGQLTTAALGAKGEHNNAGSGLERGQSAQLLKQRSWTPPTVVGDRLYVRDQHVAVAYDLNAAGAAQGKAKTADVDIPEAFQTAVKTLEKAVRRADVEAVTQAAEGFGAWSDDADLGTWAAYYRGYGFWILSQIAPQAQRLDFLDKAVDAEKEAIELDRENAEAHALLGSLYPTYYRLSPRRAAVVGPLGDEHLNRALVLEPDNPRAKAIKALDLAYSPPQWGGDLDAGLAMLRDVVATSPLETETGSADAKPTWLPAASRAWLARLLISQKPPQEEEAATLLDEVLAAYPDHAYAARLRSDLDP